MTKFRERLLQFGAGWHPVDRGSSNLQPITTRQHKSQRTERHIYGGEGKHFQLKAFGCDLLRGMMSFILGDQRCLTDWRSISFSLRLALIPLHSFLFFLPHTHSHTHTHTHTLPKHSFIPPHFFSLRERDGPELPVIPAHLAWSA